MKIDDDPTWGRYTQVGNRCHKGRPMTSDLSVLKGELAPPRLEGALQLEGVLGVLGGVGHAQLVLIDSRLEDGDLLQLGVDLLAQLGPV